jgi:hypothetical protein
MELACQTFSFFGEPTVSEANTRIHARFIFFYFKKSKRIGLNVSMMIPSSRQTAP